MAVRTAADGRGRVSADILLMLAREVVGVERGGRVGCLVVEELWVDWEGAVEVEDVVHG